MKRRGWRLAIGLCGVLAVCPVARAQAYAVGADVSFLGSAEEHGPIFKDGGVTKPGLQILKDHGYNWVRLRIFVHPTELPNDLTYTMTLAKQAKSLGYKFLLDFHYSDTWADPGKQFIPAAWQGKSHKELVETVFTYTRDTIAAFCEAGLMPDMVQIGNEITHGLLWPDGKLWDNWDNFADLIRAGIAGMEAGRGHAPHPRIMIHIERSGDEPAAIAFLDKLNTYHLVYDVIGFSYYPEWHGTVENMRATMHDLALRYRLPIIVVETAHDWEPGGFGKDKAGDYPNTPEGQREFLSAVDAAVRSIPYGLGQGVFWWEPAVPPGPLYSRGFFDDQHNALPVVTVFDSATHPEQKAQ